MNFDEEGSHSGLVQKFTKLPCRKVPRVRISPPPPMINQIEHIIGLRYRTRAMDQDLLSVVQISRDKYSWIWDPSTLITPDRIPGTQLDMESIEYLKNTGLIDFGLLLAQHPY